MAPKRPLNSSSRPPAAKRRRPQGIGAPSAADATSRLIAASNMAEHAAGGQGYLSTRDLSSGMQSLADISLRVSAEGLLKTIQLATPAPTSRPSTPGSAAAVANFGWDPNRGNREINTIHTEEFGLLRDYIKGLPEALANRLLATVLRLSAESIATVEGAAGVSVLALAGLFLHPTTTRLSLSNLGAPALLLSKIPQCTALVDLDLSTHTTLTDNATSKILTELKLLERINLRGCTKVGDASVIALSRATEERLKVANLSLTAVTIKGLTSLLARCKALEVLKIAHVAGLNEKGVKKLVDDATEAANGWRHVPLSNLRTLKVRSTDITDSSLGRLLSLCSLTLTRLDISYSAVKTLDMVSIAFHHAPEWRLEKLVASGLPLSPATMLGFFQPLAERPEEERRRFSTLKLGSIPSSSTKAPGLTDAVMEKLLPHIEKLDGLENISLFQNWDLGKRAEPMGRFMTVVGRRCKSLNLTLMLQNHHLDGLFPPIDEDGEVMPPGSYEPPKLVTLLLDSSKITDEAAAAISECRELRELHVAETRISTRFLSAIMASCPKLSVVNLTSCRGVPVTQRRNWFEAWSKGDVVVEE